MELWPATEGADDTTIVLPAGVRISLEQLPAGQATSFGNAQLEADFLSDGYLIVTDDARLLRVNREGTAVGVFGREGRGPGEFGAINALCVSQEDSLIVQDGSGRYSALDGTLTGARHFRPLRPLSMSRSGGCRPDGSIVTMGISPDGGSELLAMNRDADVVGTLQRLPPLPRGKQFFEYWVWEKSYSLIVGNPVTGTIRSFGAADSASVATYRIRLTARQRDAGQRAEWSGLAGAGSNVDWRGKPVREVTRHFRSLRLDAQQVLWVEESFERTIQTWNLYSMPVGEFLGRIALVGADSLAGRPRLMAVNQSRLAIAADDATGDRAIYLVDRPTWSMPGARTETDRRRQIQ